MSTDTHAQRQQQHLFPQQLQQQQLQQQQHQFRSNANTLAHKFTANDACHMTPSCLPAFLPSYPSDMDIYIYVACGAAAASIVSNVKFMWASERQAEHAQPSKLKDYTNSR